MLYPNPGATDYAFGIDNSVLWTSVPATAAFKWYESSNLRMHLGGDGVLYLPRGMVNLGAGAWGEITADQGLNLAVTTGPLYMKTGGRAFYPLDKYAENLGTIQNKWLTLHAAELWVETLVAQDTMATIGGRVLVGPTTTLAMDFPAGGTTLVVKHNQVKYGDWLMLEAAGKFEVLHVTYDAGMLAPGPYHYIVERNRDGSGENDWYAGDAVFNTGKIGNGFIDLYSLRGAAQASSAGPTIVGNVRISDTPTGWESRWAIGNLQGLYYQSGATYGCAFGNPYAAWLTIDATYGLRMMHTSNCWGQWDINGNVTVGPSWHTHLHIPAAGGLYLRAAGTNVISMDVAGNVTLAGYLLVGANSSVRWSGAPAWNSGFGFCFQAYADGNATFLIGNAGANRLQYRREQPDHSDAALLRGPDHRGPGLAGPGRRIWDRRVRGGLRVRVYAGLGRLLRPLPSRGASNHGLHPGCVVRQR